MMLTAEQMQAIGEVILCRFPHAGLTPSKVSCINLAVIPPRNVDRKIGQLPESDMRQIDQCLKVAPALV